MARTIRTTLRKLRKHIAEDWSDRDAQRAETRRLREEIATKRRIKAQVEFERRHPRPDAFGDPEGVPIVLEPVPAHVHHGATAEDLRGVLRRLPAGMIDGVAEIRLGLGLHGQPAPEADDEADPHTGRTPSTELLPGVHLGRVLGWYQADPASIYLCANVFVRETLAHARVVELYLRLRALATFVHEVAHHHDYRERVGRGRWRADATGKKENYAESREHELVRSAVIPYLEAAYADDVAAMHAWFAEHGGVAISLDVLAGDDRSTSRDGTRRGRLWSIATAFDALLAALRDDKDRIETRIGFAHDLWLLDRHADARTVLDRVLAADPADVDALILLAEVDLDEDRPLDAERRARAVLAFEADNEDGWLVLVGALRPQGRWAEIVEAATRGLACPGAERYDITRLASSRARAALELGESAALVRDLVGLALGPPGARDAAHAYLALHHLRSGELALALALAQQPLHYESHRAELAAVRFEAAHRLGRGADAGELAPHLARLRALAHGAWVDRLLVLA